jgi:hypothetical protein
VRAAVGEFDPRADDEVAHCTRYQHLAGRSPRADGRADVYIQTRVLALSASDARR